MGPADRDEHGDGTDADQIDAIGTPEDRTRDADEGLFGLDDRPTDVESPTSDADAPAPG